MSKGVAMYHIGRSGSTVLCDLLAKNPKISWEEEPFEPFYSGGWRGGKHRLMGKILLRSPKLGLQFKRQFGRCDWFGFDVKFYHWRDQKISTLDSLALLEKAGYERVIILKRRNFLRKVVSSVIALKRKSYHSVEEGYGKSIGKVELEVGGILIDGDRLPLLERFAGWDRSFDEIEQGSKKYGHLHLNYEDDIMADPGVAYRKVCSFLGVQPVEVSSDLKRTNPFPLPELISNWEEVCDCLSGTKWSWMLEEMGTP